MTAPDPLAGLDDVDWATLDDASGPAVHTPDRLRDLAGDEPGRRAAALDDLWGSVWHQGTVYPVTPVVVPFLVRVVADHRLPDGLRAEVALLVASTAAASSSVVGGRWFVVPFARDDDDPVPTVELDERCRAALAGEVALLEPVLAAGPPRVRTAVLAVFATVAGAVSPTAREAVALAAATADDPDVAAAAGLVLDLVDGAVTTADAVRSRVAHDPEVLDFLDHIPTFPPVAQAVEAVRELCERAVAGRDVG